MYHTDNKEKRADFSALIIVRDVFHYVPNFTVEDFTKDFDGMGADTLIPPQSGDLSGADIVLFDKSILGDVFLLHNIPEVIIRNHRYQPPYLLDMITEYGV